MTTTDTMRRPAIRFTVLPTVLLAITFGIAAPVSARPAGLSDLDADTPLDANLPEVKASHDTKAPPNASPRDLPATVAPLQQPPVPIVRAPGANPLWAIPLPTLSATRERPIFSPSRRPPPPVAAVVSDSPPPPPKPARVERPQLSLVGTIVGGDQSFGIFIDQSSKAALRLKLDEDYQGWTLRSVQGREAILARDQQTAVLSLPQPGAGEAGPLRVQADKVVTVAVPGDPPPRAGGRH